MLNIGQQIHDIVDEILNETRLAINNGELLTERLNTAMVEVNKLKKELEGRQADEAESGRDMFEIEKEKILKEESYT